MHRRSIRYIAVTLVVYAALVVTHLGEFWPFSIYPMFSNAGHPWTRALVRDVTDLDASEIWRERDLTDVPGDPVRLAEVGINQNDIANMVGKTREWDAGRIAGLRKLFTHELDQGRDLLVMRAIGALNADETVDVVLTPLILMTPGATEFAPDVPTLERE